MKPTEELSQEHRVIEKVIGALEGMAGKAEMDGKLVRADAEAAIDFIRIFADKCHHGKEEERLFPAMEANGFPAVGGPTAMMRQEHEIGRSHVRAMAGAVKGASLGTIKDLKLFVQAALGYGALLRGHIQKEDNILFPMAEQALSSAEMKRLEAEFEAVEEAMGHEVHEKYHELAHKLAEKYGVKKRSYALHNEGCAVCGEGG